MDVASFSAVVAAISVVVGVIFAIFQMRDAATTRHTGLIIQLNPSLNVPMNEIMEALSKIWNREFKDYEEYMEKYGEPDRSIDHGFTTSSISNLRSPVSLAEGTYVIIDRSAGISK